MVLGARTVSETAGTLPWIRSPASPARWEGRTAQARKTGTISYTDNLTWIHGSHTLKFGFDFRDVGEGGFDNFDSRRQLNMQTLLL